MYTIVKQSQHSILLLSTGLPQLSPQSSKSLPLRLSLSKVVSTLNLVSRLNTHFFLPFPISFYHFLVSRSLRRINCSLRSFSPFASLN